MGKQGSSTTTTEIPEWLSAALKPLLQQSTAGLQAFGQQGQNVLHGLDFNAGMPTIGAGGQVVQGGGGFNDVLRAYYGGPRRGKPKPKPAPSLEV